MCRARWFAALALLPILAQGACSKKEKESEPAPGDTPATVPAEPAPDPAADLPATPVSPEPAGGGESGAPGPGAPSEAEGETEKPAPDKPAPERPEPEKPSKPADKPDETPDRSDESSEESASLPAQGAPCADGQCGKGLTCIEYYGIAGPRGPRMTSCEIPCKGGGGCPDGQQCATIADGPGQVCRPGT